MKPLTLLLFAAFSAFGQSYSVSVVQAPSGWTRVLARSINDSGQVAALGDTGGGATQAFIGTPSGGTPIPLLFGTDGLVTTYLSINNAGQVVGSPNGQTAIATASGSTPIPAPTGWQAYTVAAAINDAGQVVTDGINPSSVNQAFIGATSGSTAVPPPAGWYSNGVPGGINSSGQIAGAGYIATPTIYPEPYIGTTAGSVAIPLGNGWNLPSIYAPSINDSGQVAGTMQQGSGPAGTPGPNQQAFVGTASGSTAIPQPSGAYYSAAGAFGQAISNAGVVVGYSSTAAGDQGWMWSVSGGIQTLTPLVPPGWTITNAIGISKNSGLILATGTFSGDVGQYNLEVAPLTVPAGSSAVTIETIAVGLQFSVDGGALQYAPATLILPNGPHTIAVPSIEAGTTGTQYVFTSWSDGGAASHSINVNGSASYTAAFQTQYLLTISAGTGGTVSPATGGYYPANAVVPIVATPNSGNTFGYWLVSSAPGPANVNAASTTVQMTGPQTLMALFVIARTQVTILTVPSGLQFSVDGGAAQTAPQASQLTDGPHTIAVAITQPGSAGTQYVFTSWSDSGAASHVVNVSGGSTTYSATFQTQNQLTVSAGSGGTVTPSGSQYYAAGTAVPISALANNGYVFTGWTGSVANPNAAATTVTTSAPQTVTANFAVATAGVTIQTNPPGLPFTVDGGAAQTAPQRLNLSNGPHTISVAATQPGAPGTQYALTSWSDGGAASHSITVNGAPLTLTATFETQYQLTTSASPVAGGVVRVSGAGFFNAGAVVTLSAVSSLDYGFVGWQGNVANSNAPSTTITMNGPQTVTGDFKPVRPAERRR